MHTNSFVQELQCAFSLQTWVRRRALLSGGRGTALWGKAAVRQPLGGRGEPGMGRRLSPQEIDSSGLIVCLGTPVRMPPRKLNNSCPPFNLFDLDAIIYDMH